MTPIERRRLQSTHKSTAEIVARSDSNAVAAANLTFHTLIYAGAHNEIITEFASGLRQRLAPFCKAQFRIEGRLPCSSEEHGNVVRAILAGGAHAAHTSMFHHISPVEESFDKLAAAAI